MFRSRIVRLIVRVTPFFFCIFACQHPMRVLWVRICVNLTPNTLAFGSGLDEGALLCDAACGIRTLVT